VSVFVLGLSCDLATYLVLVIGMQVQTRLLGALPVVGYALVDIGLVYDLGDQLRAFADGVGVWRRQFGARDGIFVAVDDEQAEESPDAVHCKAQDEDGRDEEYEHASPHVGCSGPRTVGDLLFLAADGRRGARGVVEVAWMKTRGGMKSSGFRTDTLRTGRFLSSGGLGGVDEAEKTGV
jgi:hypothetical protein